AEVLYGLFGELLLLVRGVAAFNRAEPVTLHGFRKNERGAALVLGRHFVSVVDLQRVVTTAMQVADLVVGHVIHKRRGFGITAEKFLADVSTAARLERLIIAIDAFVHELNEASGLVLLEETIPVTAPDTFNNVPSGATEQTLVFLDDLAVAADRAIKALQIAVDNEDQVIEFLAHGDANRTGRFGLVHLAVAEERPDLAVRCRNQFTALEIAHEARLIDRIDRPEAHRDRRELPEVFHEPWVRIGAEARGITQFVAEVIEMIGGQTAFEESAGINPGGSMALKVNQVAGLIAVAAVEEVIEADFEQSRERRIGGDVSTD